MSQRQIRVVVGGQVPPPQTGQNVMVRELLSDLRTGTRFEVVHLPFRFAKTFGDMGRVEARKVVSLIRIIVRAVSLRLRGPIDCVVYPVTGTRWLSLVRDTILITLLATLSPKLILQFHAGGHATDLPERPLMRRLCRLAFRRAATAVVMAKFNRIDPIFLGVRDVRVIPHTIDDDCVNEFVDRNGSPRILYVGHMAPQRGTDALIRAFADIAVDHPDATLHLVGRCVRPFTEDRLEELVARSGVGNRITISGELSGDDKRRAFGQADLFVFPTVHPTESFGLVLIEAMMWSLPIVATNWRGNSDVLGPRFGGACFDIGSAGLAPSLVATLRHVLAHDELFGAWGKLNREVFDQRYNKARVPADLVRLIVGMATERHATRGSPPP